MSRSGYIDDDDCDRYSGLWRGGVVRAITGKRGQTLLREALAALEAMPEKTLAAESLVTADGEFCTLGALGNVRGINMGHIDPEDWDHVAFVFSVAPSLVREIVYQNDECVDRHEWIEVEICGPLRPWDRRTRSSRRDFPAHEVAAERWKHMHKWLSDHIVKTRSEEAVGHGK